MLTAGGAADDPAATAAAFLQSLTRSGPIVVGLSGGGDSTALLVALQMALQMGTAPARQLIAATVDHGLRPASADEARRVGDFCAARGI
ncbi:MAG TPA: ATP-binding protein, partial [Pararhizobium sp.]|nr:ATP-binding protein [Pararhizobium sp.]